MLDEAQDADPVILGLLERHKGARIVVGDKYQQLYQWRGAVNALSRMRSDSAELSLTRTFRFGADAAEWANRVLEIIGEKLRIVPAPHRTTVSIEEKSVRIDALLARTNAGTLDEAIHGLERRRKKSMLMGGADPLIRLIRGGVGSVAPAEGRSSRVSSAMFATWGTNSKLQPTERKTARPATRRSEFSFGLYRIVIGRFFTCAGGWKPVLNLLPPRRSRSAPFHKAKGLEWPRVLMSSDFNQFGIRAREGQTGHRHGGGLHHVCGADPCPGEIDSLSCMRGSNLRFGGYKGRECPHQGFTRC